MNRLVIISGLSGSGKSTAVKALEDLGYYCIDNLPPTLLPNFIELCEDSFTDINKVALVIDIREGRFLERAPEVIKQLKAKGHNLDIIFLESTDTVLLKRYKETRRKHPLSEDGNVLEGIKKEREMLSELKLLADYDIDTSEFTVHQLREVVQNKFDTLSSRKLALNILSFGYKHGFPYDADIVLDVRFLPNPYFDDGLKHLSGRDKDVEDYIMSHSDTQVFMDKLIDFLEFLVPKYEEEGKSYLTIGIGCTGGKHRSVVIASRLKEVFKGYDPTVQHRDIEKK